MDPGSKAYREDDKKRRHTGKTMVNESGNDGEEGQCLYGGDFEPPWPMAAILRTCPRPLRRLSYCLATA